MRWNSAAAWAGTLTTLSLLVACGCQPQSAASKLAADTTQSTAPASKGAGMMDPPLAPTAAAAPAAPLPGADAFERLLTAIDTQSQEAWLKADAELQQLGDQAIPLLQQRLKDSRTLVREFASNYLAQMGPNAAPAISELRQLADDESAQVQLNVATVLTFVDDHLP